MDKDLLQCFIEEVRGYIPQIQNHVETFYEDLACTGSIKEAYRFVHSIKGASSMMGLSSLSHVSHLVEEVLENLNDSNLDMTPQVEDFLQKATVRIESYVNQLTPDNLGDRPLFTDVVKSYRRVMGLPESEDESELELLISGYSEIPDGISLPQKPTSNSSQGYARDIDSELVEVFMVEADQHLQNIQDSSSELKKNPQNRVCLREIRRSAHTLKGAGVMVGFDSVSDLSGRMEKLVESLIEQDIDPSESEIDLLFATSDAVRTVLYEGGDKKKIERIIEKLTGIYSNFSDRKNTQLGDSYRSEFPTVSKDGYNGETRYPTPDLSDEEKLGESGESTSKELTGKIFYPESPSVGQSGQGFSREHVSQQRDMSSTEEPFAPKVSRSQSALTPEVLTERIFNISTRTGGRINQKTDALGLAPAQFHSVSKDKVEIEQIEKALGNFVKDSGEPGQSKDIQPELLEIFLVEAGEHIQKMATLLSGLEKSSPKSPQARETLYELRRIVHTLKGAAGLAGFKSVSNLTHKTEDLLEMLHVGTLDISPDSMKLLFESSDLIEDTLRLTAAGSGEDMLSRSLDELYLRYSNLREEKTDYKDIKTDKPSLQDETAQTGSDDYSEQPSSSTPSDVSTDEFFSPVSGGLSDLSPSYAEVKKLIISEASESINEMNRSLSGLNEDTGNKAHMRQLLLSIRTIKNLAWTTGFFPVYRLSERMENLITKLLAGGPEIQTQAMTLLSSASLSLSNMMSGDLDRVEQEGSFECVMSDYDGSLAEKLLFSERHAEKAEETSSYVSESGSREPASFPIGISDAGDETSRTDSSVEDFSSGSVAPGMHKRSEFVRIPLERLDELVNLVSELVVNHSSFECYYGLLMQEVGELQSSVERLRRVTSKMETQYEVLALRGTSFGKYPRAAAGPSGSHSVVSTALEFDELELDRYTEFHLFSRELSETTSDVGTIRNEMDHLIGDFEGSLSRQQKLTSRIQDRMMKLRMVPLSTLSMRFHRLVRVTADERGKSVDFTVDGEDVELDRSIMEGIVDPLGHLLRNAVAHGIEPPHERREKRKPEMGTVSLSAYYSGTQVVIRVRDDGAGIGSGVLRSVAIEGGFITSIDAKKLSDNELYSLVFLPGLSTAGEITGVSGRGMGMDIVKSTVERLKGTVSVSSAPGKGAEFTIRLPMTLASARVIMVRQRDQVFAVPFTGVNRVLRLGSETIGTLGRDRIIRLEGKVYPLIHLDEALGIRHYDEQSHSAISVLTLDLGDRQIALVVDEVGESREVVVKSLGSHLRHVRGIAGATIMGDGTVALILNPAELVRKVAKQEFKFEPEDVASQVDGDTVDVLIVDDSVSVRRILSNLIRNAGWNSASAKDGVEALETLQRSGKNPDIILLDIEMPRMDGYELLSILKSEISYSEIPVVIITSRAGEKHRRKAYELGADEYVVKPYQDETLLALINELTGS